MKTLVRQELDVVTKTRSNTALRGWRGKRGSKSDCSEMLRTGRHLFLWTALTKEACAARSSEAALVDGMI